MIDKSIFENIKFEDLKRVYLGGTGRMYRIEINGISYLYKPAEQKGTHKKQLFRGYVQECASNIQKIIDENSFVPCTFINNENLCGTFQIEVPHKDVRYGVAQDTLDYEFSDNEINCFLREFITDYLLYNFDSHGSNFIVDNNGIIRGIDKEQSFRFIADLKEDFFDLDCNPNDIYGEREMIYHYIFRRYINNTVNIDFSILNQYITKIENISNSDYLSIFNKYIESRKERIDSDYLAKLILDKKIYLRERINNFINDLESKKVNIIKR